MTLSFSDLLLLLDATKPLIATLHLEWRSLAYINYCQANAQMHGRQHISHEAYSAFCV